METLLKEDTKYTVIKISDWLAITTKEEIIIIRYSSIYQRYIYRQKGRKKDLILPVDAHNWLFFEGHGLPLKLDSETDRFMGNTQFNFVASNPEQLKQYILNNCINPDTDLLEKIMVTPERRAHRKGSYPYIPLFGKVQ